MTTISKRKIHNAIYIKVRNIMETPAIKVILLIAFIASMGVSFFPFIQTNILKDQVIVGCNVDMDLDLDSVVEVTLGENLDNQSKYDLIITSEQGKYIINVYTQKGYAKHLEIANKIARINRDNIVSNNFVALQILSIITGENIKIELDDEIVETEDNIASFIMMITFIFFLVMTLLITRIGVQVAAEKGNKVTETILTSITKKQLFFAQVISSILVTAFSFIIVSIPMIVAYLINDPLIVSDFSFFTVNGIITFLTHLIVISATLVIAGIAIGSSVKNVEDANTMTFLIMLPVMASYIYYIVNLDIFRGVLAFLNYVPFISIFPVFGGMLRGLFSLQETIVLCVIDVVFFMITYSIAGRIYCKKIQ